MTLTSINPATEDRLAEFEETGESALDKTLQQASDANQSWSMLTPTDRGEFIARLANRLELQTDANARLISLEMGKPIEQAKSEVEKCVRVCRYYADNGSQMLEPDEYASDATRSYVEFQPLGTVLAIMPWNFPFWQLFRCAVPALMAGNTVILKHASNVSQCAQAIQQLFDDAAFPDGVFQTIFVSGKRASELLDDSRVAAVSLTGSTAAGAAAAGRAGRNIKTSVLELGGSDAFVVLPDADLQQAVSSGVTARYQNTGQSCIAAKRFIVCEEIADDFVDAFIARADKQTMGDPLDDSTELGPMARGDLREALHDQATDSIRQGAKPVLGCERPVGPGFFYPASVLDRVESGMPAYSEETFGPLAAVIRVADEEAAIDVANDSPYGLGSTIFSADVERAEMLARTIQAGATFINGMVKSDPRLPFGGIKESGFGRELADLGIREFVNAKTVWIA